MITTLVVSGIVGLLIPFITDFLTKSNAPLWMKSTLNLALSSLAAVIVTVSLGDYASLNEYLGAIFVAWTANMRMHYTGATKPIAAATASFGVDNAGKHNLSSAESD